MNKQDLEYILNALNYGLKNCNDKNGDAETHYNSFANAIEIVKGLIKMNEHLRDINTIQLEIWTEGNSIDGYWGIIKQMNEKGGTHDNYSILYNGVCRGCRDANKEQAIERAILDTLDAIKKKLI